MQFAQCAWKILRQEKNCRCLRVDMFYILHAHICGSTTAFKNIALHHVHYVISLLYMFAMRLHSYTWDCMPCPTSTYKTTNTLLLSDCLVCGTNGINTCPELEKKCTVDSDLIVSQTTSLFYTNHMKMV